MGISVIIMTNIFSTLFEARTLPEIVLIAVVIVVVIAIVVALFCLCNCCCKLCIEPDEFFDIEVPKQDAPPPSYLRNETVNMNQVQNQAAYDYETLPQPLPKFGLLHVQYF